MHRLLFSAAETYPMVELRTRLEDLAWVTGKQLIRPPASLRFHLDAPAPFFWPDFLQPAAPAPLFSAAMRAALTQAGASSVEYVPARVTNGATGEERVYSAANVLGLIAAMDRTASAFTPARRHPVIVRSIDRLVLDAKRCGTRPLFRLAEFDLLLVVAGTVAEALAHAGLVGVRTIEPEQWDGFTT